MSSSFETILENYCELLKTVDRWFAHSAKSAEDAVLCGKGCSSCCRGLFDITLLDAFYLRQGFEGLAHSVQEKVRARVASQLDSLRLSWPGISPPYIINGLPEEELGRLMPEEDPTPCPLLGDDGLCLVYENRPMTCRLHGIPLVDISGDFFHDEWCTCNFKSEDPLENHTLRWNFRELFQDELFIFQDFTSVLLNHRINELDTLIPLAVLIDFDGFDWEGWWLESADKIRNADSQESRQNIQSLN